MLLIRIKAGLSLFSVKVRRTGACSAMIQQHNKHPSYHHFWASIYICSFSLPLSTLPPPFSLTHTHTHTHTEAHMYTSAHTNRHWQRHTDTHKHTHTHIFSCFMHRNVAGRKLVQHKETYWFLLLFFKFSAFFSSLKEENRPTLKSIISTYASCKKVNS